MQDLNNRALERMQIGEIALGMRFILGGNDFSFMMAGAKQRAKTLRGED